MMEQHSQEWWDARRGKVTASRIADVMARTKTGWGAARGHYLNQLVAERITGQVKALKRVASLEQRLELEPEARIAYEFYSDNKVQEVGFIEHPTIPNAGASPDGLIGTEGGLELKCCDTPAHIEMLLTEVIDPGYVLQCYFGMACMPEREWWDFGSYEPTMPEEVKLLVKRIERDDARIAEIESAVVQFNAEVDAKVEMVQSLIATGKSPLLLALEKSLEENSHVIQ